MPSPGGENMPNGVSSPSNQQSSPNGTNRSGTLENANSQATATQPTANGTQSTAQASQPQSQPHANAVNGARTPSQARNTPDPAERKKPRDARLIHTVLANQGVRSYEERVPLQLMDFAYRYSVGVLQDAISLGDSSLMGAGGRGGGAATGAGDSAVSLGSLRLAIGARLGRQFQPHMPKEFMMELAQERNKIAIKPVEKSFGHRLPPEQFCLTGTGWGLKDEWMSEADDDADDGLEITINKETKEGEGDDTVMGEAEDEDMEQFEEVMMGNS